MPERKYEEVAKRFCDAIRAFNEEGLDNLESYLSYHFAEWMNKYANDPEGIAFEMESFSTIGVELPF